jgi:DNA-directed RNA polymerase subunit L
MKDEDINITVNTSRFNNEILKQRIQCIPVHILDDSDEINEESSKYLKNKQNANRSDNYFKAIHPEDIIKKANINIDSMLVMVDVENKENQSIYVTTGDMKIVSKKESGGDGVTFKEVMIPNDDNSSQSEKGNNKGTPLSDIVFPKDPITNEHIVIARLKPAIDRNGTSGSVGEALKFTAKLNLGTAKENGSFNVVSTCAYENKVDNEKSGAGFEEIHGKPSDPGNDKMKENWDVLEGKREKYCCSNEFKFYIETVGVYSNLVILHKACYLMRERCDKFIKSIQENNTSHVKIVHNKNTTQPLEFCVTLFNEDYTLGNPLVHFLFKKYDTAIQSTDVKMKQMKMTFVGFKVPHPHIDAGVIRIMYEKGTGTQDADEATGSDDDQIVDMLMEHTMDELIVAAKEIKKKFEEIGK